MPNELESALFEQRELNEPNKLTISGKLGIPLGGTRLVEVPNRNSFVYVQLRDNQNEVIQAFNNKVAPSYGLPVVLQREGTRYIVLGVDTQRYQNNWNSFAPYLPRHGNTHSRLESSGGGGDVTWVASNQFMPLLPIPSGSSGGSNVIVSPHVLLSTSGTWAYVGNTGTQTLLQYVPTGSNAVMVLVYLDRLSGNPYIVVNSGSYFPNSITGTAEVTPYIPNVPQPSLQVPLGAIRLTTGTYNIGWDNIYDVRQFLQYISTGTIVQGGASSIDTIGFAGLYNGTPIGTGTFLNVRGNATFTKSGSMFDLNVGGGGGGGGNGIMVWDEGVPLGTGTVMNFVGSNISATISGSVVRVFVTGSGGGSSGYPFALYLEGGAGTTVANNTDDAQISIDTEQYDPNNLATLASDTITIASSGWYRVHGMVEYAGGAAFNGRCLLTIESTSDFFIQKGYTTAMGIDDDVLAIEGLIELTASDTIQIFFSNHLGTSVDVFTIELSFEKQS